MSKSYPKNSESLAETCSGGRKMDVSARKVAADPQITSWSKPFTTKLKTMS